MILEQLIRKKRYFDEYKKSDVKSAKIFFQTNSWRHEKTCPFILEYPYLTVPDMIKDRIICKMFGIDRSVQQFNLRWSRNEKDSY